MYCDLPMDTTSKWVFGNCFIFTLTKIGNIDLTEFDPWLILTDPYMIFDPINALHFGQGFFLSNLVNWYMAFLMSILTPGWSQHNLQTGQCITLWSGFFVLFCFVLFCFFEGGGCHFESNFTSGWPWWGRFQNMLLSLQGPIPCPTLCTGLQATSESVIFRYWPLNLSKFLFL